MKASPLVSVSDHQRPVNQERFDLTSRQQHVLVHFHHPPVTDNSDFSTGFDRNNERLVHFPFCASAACGSLEDTVRRAAICLSDVYVLRKKLGVT